jgi:hypothetical protein
LASLLAIGIGAIVAIAVATNPQMSGGVPTSTDIWQAIARAYDHP